MLPFQEVELLPLETEFENTLRNLKKGLSVESSAMAEHKEVQQNTQVEETIQRPQRQRTLGNF